MHNAFMADKDDIARGRRLRQAREEIKKATPEEAHRALRVAYSTYMNWENGDRGFRRHAPRLAEWLGVNLRWLLDGTGPIRISEREQVARKIDRLNPDELRLLLTTLELWDSRKN